VCSTTIFIILLLGCYSRSTFVGQNSTPIQRDPNRNISGKDLQRFQSSIKKIDGSLEAQYKQALYFQKKNNHKIAIVILNEVIQKDPSYHKAYNALGISYDYLGNYNKAINSYNLALKINPELDYVHNNLGYSHLLHRELDSAIDAFQKAIALNENNKRYHNNLGLAYAQKGQFDLAIEQFSIASDEISANNKLSHFLYREGKHELARKYQQRALQQKAAISSEKSTKILNRNKYSEYSSKLEEKSNSENAPQNNNQKENIDNTVVESTRGHVTYNESIEEGSEAGVPNDKNEKSLVKADINHNKNKPLKMRLENQRSKTVQNLAEPEIEVSNGSGVNRIATRMGNYLKDKGLKVTLITNADHFGYTKSKIYYCENYLQDAYKVAQKIPGWQDMERAGEFSRKNIKIRVLIGKDLKYNDWSPTKSEGKASFRPYSILLSSCRLQESVQKVLFNYHKIGLDPFVVKVKVGKNELWWRVFLGHYKSREEALNVIKEKGLSNSIVMKVS
jgi:Flp pilus assembly protein TadD